MTKLVVAGKPVYAYVKIVTDGCGDHCIIAGTSLIHGMHLSFVFVLYQGHEARYTPPS
jgi:hypothetical protein